MFNIIPIGYINVASGFLISLLVAILGYVLFYWMWTKNHDFHFPRGNLN